MTMDAQKAEALELFLREHLDADIVAELSSRFGISVESAMDRYYRSRLAASISEGAFGVQYLSAGYLVEDLLANEPELFDDLEKPPDCSMPA